MGFMNRPLTSLVLLLTTIFFFSSSLLAMEEDKEKKIPVSMNPQNMTREELETLVFSQQEKLSTHEKYLTPEEKETNRLLNIPLSTSVVILIDALKLTEEKKCSLEEALDIIENDEGYDIAKKLTSMAVLKDKKNFSNDIVRKLFRGMVVGIKEEGTLNFRCHAHLGPDLTMDEWISSILSLPYHLIKVIYPNESVTASLINIYLNTRQDAYLGQRIATQSLIFGMF